MVEHLAKAPQVPAELLHFNGCSIDQQVYAVCYFNWRKCSARPLVPFNLARLHRAFEMLMLNDV